MIKIGYLGAEPDSENYGFELLDECQPVNIGMLGGSLSRCPSVKGYHMNTFEIKCPFDLEWSVWQKGEDENHEFQWSINPKASSINVTRGFEPFDFDVGTVNDPKGFNCQVKLRPEWSFVSDTPGTIMLQHSNGITTNPQIISGMLDIYKWPDRQMSTGYHIDESKKTFRLKKGEPWYRVSFITPNLEPVKLVRMEERPPFLLKTRNKVTLTQVQYVNWRKIFDAFGKRRPKKLINA